MKDNDVSDVNAQNNCLHSIADTGCNYWSAEVCLHTSMSNEQNNTAVRIVLWYVRMLDFRFVDTLTETRFRRKLNSTRNCEFDPKNEISGLI